MPNMSMCCALVWLDGDCEPADLRIPDEMNAPLCRVFLRSTEVTLRLFGCLMN